ncbi:hypothetical protein LCGC14_2683340, partial [marine sediment metagenome]
TYGRIIDKIDGEVLIVTDTIVEKKHYSRRWLLEEKQRIDTLLTELDRAELKEP